jgi:hypothetical protein
MIDDKHQLNTVGGQVSVDEMASNIMINKLQSRNAFLKKAKKAIEIIGYEYKPYYNRPKKRHLGKIIVVLQNTLNGIVYRRLVAQNIPTKICVEFIQIIDKKELKKIHKERSKKINYGFIGNKNKKKE